VHHAIGTHALFPDSVTERGTKHLKTLIAAKERGERAIMVYITQRQDVLTFGPAYAIDKNYAKTFEEAYQKGVEMYAYKCHVHLQGLTLQGPVPLQLGM
jgi:sugar fermentation stimulation protein A